MKSTFFTFFFIYFWKKKEKKSNSDLICTICHAKLLCLLSLQPETIFHVTKDLFLFPRRLLCLLCISFFIFLLWTEISYIFSNWLWLFILDLCFPKVGSNEHIHVICNTIMGTIIVIFQLIILWMLIYTYSYSTPTEKGKKRLWARYFNFTIS